MAKEFGDSNVGAVRSLRRTLQKMVREDIVTAFGSGRRGDPYRYRISAFMRDEALQSTKVGMLLLEARMQFQSRDEFCSWVKQNFDLSDVQAYDLMVLTAIEAMSRKAPENGRALQLESGRQ